MTTRRVNWRRSDSVETDEQCTVSIRDSGLSLVNQEPGTTLWFALHLGGASYGIFDVFLDTAGRDEHLHGKVAEALMAQAPDLFTDAPKIQTIDIRAAKLA